MQLCGKLIILGYLKRSEINQNVENNQNASNKITNEKKLKEKNDKKSKEKNFNKILVLKKRKKSKNEKSENLIQDDANNDLLQLLMDNDKNFKEGEDQILNEMDSQSKNNKNLKDLDNYENPLYVKI